MKNQPGLDRAHLLTLKTGAGEATLALAQKGRSYLVTNFEVLGRPELALGFCATGPGVENLDETSDARQCFGVSTKIRLDGVVLSNKEMRANSLEELRSALMKAKIRLYSPEEV